MTQARDFDVVVYGASGFVGAQAAHYLHAHAPGLRLGLAGRDAAKLKAIQQGGAQSAQVLVADAQDSATLSALAARTRVVLSCAGPFALYGSALVAACVEQGTHYVDITGETPWVRGLIDQHHAQAVRKHTRIIPFCGFDSVPSDLGAWLLARSIWQRFGRPCVNVKAAFSMRGGLNGGTLASALNMMESGQADKMADPFLLNPVGGAPREGLGPHQDPIAPHRDEDFKAWLGPFVMAPINTRVVRRSAALLAAAGDPAYTLGLTYQEYLRFGSGPLAAMTAAGVSVGMGLGQGAMRLGVGRRIARALAPAPGEGPSQSAMDNGRWRCELVGRASSGQTLRATLSGKGDPGNRATTIFVCESALALALNYDELPGAPARGGVLTPASGLGDVLARRLDAAGIKIEIGL